MPRYDQVSDDAQIPAHRTVPAPASPSPAVVDPLVPITTDIPGSLRRDVRLACAIHGVKLKDVVADALRAWLAEHPPQT